MEQIDGIMLEAEKPKLLITATPKASNDYKVYIRDDIDSADHFADLIELLHTAGEEDVFNLYFSTNGGMLDATQELLAAMSVTQALIVGHLTNKAISAGSIIFLNCHEWQVYASSHMMIHQMSYSTGGGNQNVKGQVDFYSRMNENLVRDNYTGFLTEEEIQSVLHGKDVYLDAVEVAQRLTGYARMKRDKYEALVSRMSSETEEVIVDGVKYS